MYVQALVVSLVAAAAAANAHAAGKSEAATANAATARAVQSSAAVEQMMRADVNKDGMVTRDEVDRLDSRLGRRFSAADADRDGKLNLREFERLRELSRGATAGGGPGGTAAGGGPGSARR